MKQGRLPNEDKTFTEIQVKFQQLRNEVGSLRMDVKAFHAGRDLPEPAAKRLAFFEARLEGAEQALRRWKDEIKMLISEQARIGKDMSILEHRADKIEGSLGILVEGFHKLHERVYVLEEKNIQEKHAVIDVYDKSGHVYRYEPKVTSHKEGE